MNHATTASTLDVTLGGLLGEAIGASQRGRLSSFIVDEASPALRLFGPEHRERNTEGDWYGEHAGKWLIAAARAAARSGDATLRERVQHAARWLAGQQQPDGYLGTYAATHRFSVPQPPKPGTWDGAPARRTWDIWIHAYLMLGLLEVHRHFPEQRLLDAACRIGDLCLQVLTEGGLDITTLGNHHGLSATVLLDPAAQLYLDTGEPRYLQLALRVLEQADAEPRLQLLRQALAGADAADIATAKAYQLQWNLVGLAKLWHATGREDLMRAVEALWTSIRTHHLTLGGGPWGGVAHRSREVFNAPGSFSPQAYVETCSTLAWIQLNRELLQLTGDARYADEIERSAYNDLLGALAPNGEDWCYYVFPNGRRVHTTYWRCCKSSGAMALEELALAAWSLDITGAVPMLAMNLIGPADVRATLPDGRVLCVQAYTAYPFDGRIELVIRCAEPLRLALKLRIPPWAAGATLQLAGQVPLPAEAGHFVLLDRSWHDGERIVLQLPIAARFEVHCHRNVQESRAPDGSTVRQEVLRQDVVALLRGPLVYATDGLIDGFKSAETIRLPDGALDRTAPPGCVDTLPGDASGDGPLLRLNLADRPPIHFAPYYRAGGRSHGAWRLTWLSLAPADEPPATDEPPID
ncbi:glycoside hydrolase family 127 protein [Aquincola sp. S2]|uniref:Glycoside hydrolase family 127 protein n=1 Tax=Pseudaquabacterium terrae TaxID=2732868 RepID=A0ABX2ED25_9BURK|nr:beta-L-arabinofuranosidase domain-containing protein [Aquabacterium terrae]NRF65815.1 glycoside hydrolase family 127 protein [Aquabacterium terrae]